MSAPAWAGRYIGLPFEDGGRGPDAFDCWGLVRAVLASQAGISLPSYGETPAGDLAAVARAMGQGDASWRQPWSEVERSAARPLDVVLMTGRGRVAGRPQTLACHVGIMVTPRLVLHVEEATAAAVVPLDHPLIRHRIVALYRHSDLQ